MTKIKAVNSQRIAGSPQILIICGLFFLMLTPLSLNALSVDEQLKRAESLRLSDPEEFRWRLESIKTQKQEMTFSQICLFDFLEGYKNALDGDFLKLNTYFEPVLDRCPSPEIQARIKALLANVQVISGQFEMGVRNIDEAIQISQKVPNNEIKSTVYLTAASVYEQMEQGRLSSQYASMGYQFLPNEDSLCKANFFKYSFALKQSSSNLNNELKDAVDHCISNNSPIPGLILNLRYARKILKNDEVLYQKEDLHKKLLSLNDLVLETRYANLKAYYFAVLSESFEYLQNLDKAIEFADKSLTVNEGLGDTEHKIMALDVKVRVSLKRANDKMAFQVLNEKTQSEQRRFNEKQAKLAAFMKVKHENIVKEHEISQLNQKNKLLEMEQLIAEKQAVNQRLMLTLLLVVVSFLTLWIWRAHKRQKELKLLSEMDHLTQVLNRQGLEANVMPNLKSAESRNAVVNLAILDLDHFKKINDQFGHMAGDWALKHVIGLVSRHMNRHMVLGRLGGEEFAIWFFDTTTKEAKASIEHIRKAIDELDCSESGHDMHITASFGMSNSIESGYGLAQLLSHADQALYQAKHQGRNQVVMYQHKSRLQETGPAVQSV